MSFSQTRFGLALSLIWYFFTFVFFCVATAMWRSFHSPSTRRYQNFVERLFKDFFKSLSIMILYIKDVRMAIETDGSFDSDSTWKYYYVIQTNKINLPRFELPYWSSGWRMCLSRGSNPGSTDYVITTNKYKRLTMVTHKVYIFTNFDLKSNIFLSNQFCNFNKGISYRVSSKL